MKSPFSGKEMPLKSTRKEVAFRKESFTIHHHYYLCEDTGETFTTDELDALNVSQVYNQYRERHSLPFPDQITKVRELYGLSAAAMAKVLGFGVNIYRNYENGEVPSESNARLIQLIMNPDEFKKLVCLSGVYEGKKLDKLLERIQQIKREGKKQKGRQDLMALFQGARQPNRFSGYRRPDLKRLTALVLYFADRLKPYKTKLNKLLFYADFLHFSHHGYSISGVRYAAIDMGPVPHGFNGLFGWMEQEDFVEVHRTEFPSGGIGEQFVPGDKAVADEAALAGLFSEGELTTLNRVVEAFGDVSTQQMIEVSHAEPAWLEQVEQKALISYEYAFSLKAFPKN